MNDSNIIGKQQQQHRYQQQQQQDEEDSYYFDDIARIASEPIWLQTKEVVTTTTTTTISGIITSDNNDESSSSSSSFISSSVVCLGPTGSFSECGDATLWFAQPIRLDHNNNNDRSKNKKRNNMMDRKWRIGRRLFELLRFNNGSSSTRKFKNNNKSCCREEEDSTTTTSAKDNNNNNNSMIIGWTFHVVDDYDYYAISSSSSSPTNDNHMRYNNNNKNQQSSSTTSRTTNDNNKRKKKTKRQSGGGRNPQQRRQENEHNQQQQQQQHLNTECLQYDLATRTVQVQKCNNNKNVKKRYYRRLFQSRKNNKNNSSVWMVNEHGYLQTVPASSTTKKRRFPFWQQQKKNHHEEQQPKQRKEPKLCLGRHRRKENRDQQHPMNLLLVPCTSEDAIGLAGVSGEKKEQPKTATTITVLRDDEVSERIIPVRNNNNDNNIKPVAFSFIRYRAVPIASPITVATTPVDERHGNHTAYSQATTTRRRHHRGDHHHSSRTISSSRVKNNYPSSRKRKDHHHRSPSSSRSSNNNSNLPSNRDMAAIRSNAAAVHPGLTLSKRIQLERASPVLRNTNPILFVSASSPSSQKQQQQQPSSSSSSSSSRSSSRKMNNNNNKMKKSSDKNQQNHHHHHVHGKHSVPATKYAHPPPIQLSSSSLSSDASTVQQQIHHHHYRIHRHPYIDAASKNNIWTCPSTGLEYHTDLGNYLGWTKKEKGRHTLTGVGVYRKGYVIKVYGIAYYVSKRDVLANPVFMPYADKTAAELRVMPKFYELLRTMNEETKFDRTILLKTNMQLAAETMRSSLQADWSYLSDEMKSTLVGASMRPRPASERMLKLIQSTSENPSRCSCSQVAPPEYNANPDCCARGTELAFTWTKNDHLELRLNGELQEAFPRPDIASGIFFEYLRHDDPISPELREHVVDGFPFLLSPLAQVKGISSMSIGGHHHHDSKGTSSSGSTNKAASSQSNNPLTTAFHAAGSAFETIGHGAAGFVSTPVKVLAEGGKYMLTAADQKRAWVVSHAVEVPRSIMKVVHRDEETLQAMSSWGKSVVKDADHAREWLVSSAVAVPSAAAKLLRRDEETLQSISTFADRMVATMMNVMSATDEDDNATIAPDPNLLSTLDGQQQIQLDLILRAPRGRAFGYPFSRWLGGDDYMLHAALDEIGPMKIHPTMTTARKVFLALVHFYLLLLFIVSFPGSYSTRTKLIVIRKHQAPSTKATDSCQDILTSDSESSETNSRVLSSCEDEDISVSERQTETLSRHNHSTAKHNDNNNILLRAAEKVTKSSPSKMLRRKHNVFSRAAHRVLSSARRANHVNSRGDDDNNNKNSNDDQSDEANQMQQSNEEQLTTPRGSKNTVDELSISTDSGNRLKKKSLSYFL